MKAKLVLATQQLINETKQKIMDWHDDFDIEGFFIDGSVGLPILEWELNKRGLTAYEKRATYTNNKVD